MQTRTTETGDGIYQFTTYVERDDRCDISLNDLADRPPRPLADGEVLDIGGHRMRWIDTPHVPHGWEAGIVYDEASRTLLCGDPP